MARIGSVCTGPSEGEGQGRGSPGNRGGGVRKANEERAGSEGSNRVGSGRNWENYITVPNILQWKRDLRDEAKKKEQEMQNTGGRKIGPRLSLSSLSGKSQFIRLFSSADKYDNSVIQ